MSQAFGKEKANNIYFSAANGALAQRYPEPDGWDGICDFMQGTFTGFRYYFDEGNPAKMVEPGMRLDIMLQAQVNDVPTGLVIQAKVPNTFSRMVASHLPNINQGDMLKFRVWAGTDNQKVTVCMVDRLDPDSGAWEKVKRVELPPSVPARTPTGKPDTTAKDERVHQILESHPAKREKKAHDEPEQSRPVAAATKDTNEYDPFADE